MLTGCIDTYVIRTGVVIVQDATRGVYAYSILAGVRCAGIAVITSNQSMQASAVHTSIRSAGIVIIQVASWGEHTCTIHTGVCGAAIIVITNDGSINTSCVHAVIGSAQVTVAAGSNMAANTVLTVIRSACIAVITIKLVAEALSTDTSFRGTCISIGGT